MNLTIKKEWYDVAESLDDTERAKFYVMLTRYSFEGIEPEESNTPAVLIFRLIRPEIDRDMKAKEKRRERRERKKTEERPSDNRRATDARPKSDQATTEEKPKTTRFTKPTVEEVAAYCKEKGYTNVSPKKFYNYYEANGWRVGRNPMKNWKASVTNWATNNYTSGQKTAGTVWEKEPAAGEIYENLL